ncbi:MAG: hypothetical protein KME17_23700 [Cyanosarcina radialis HA8281-LM2]|nr:hypothetical protein [Cyanosarcina radialis HA8281-LM2]
MARFPGNSSNAPLPSLPFWCIVRRLPNSQNIAIGVFSSRAAAEEQMHFLAKMSPNTTYDVVFDFGLH